MFMLVSFTALCSTILFALTPVLVYVADGAIAALLLSKVLGVRKLAGLNMPSPNFVEWLAVFSVLLLMNTLLL